MKKAITNRNDKVKVKTAKGRRLSSTLWLERQLNDPYVKQAKIDGFRSRAAYKLIQINDKFKFIKPGQLLMDLGAAPGGWSQVAVKIMKPEQNKFSQIIAIDLQEIEPISHIDFLHGDFTNEHIYQQLINKMEGRKADVIVSDMAAAACGNPQVDHDRIIALCEMVFDFAFEHLNKDGAVVVKVLRGGAEQELLTKVKQSFTNVKHFKPEASRADSAEMYLIALGYKG